MIKNIITSKREVYNNLIKFKTADELVIPPMQNGRYRQFRERFKDYIEVEKITKGFKIIKKKDFDYNVLFKNKNSIWR